MKMLSAYTITRSRQGDAWLFSTRTGAIAKLELSDDIGLVTFKTDINNHLSAAEYHKLWALGFLSEGSRSSELKEIQDAYTAAQYRLSSLDVTIAPTLGCNYSCYYCFEKKTELFRNRQAFDPDVTSRVIDYVVSNLPGRSSLNLRWFGGEPLLAIDQVLHVQSVLSTICNEAEVPIRTFIQTNGSLLNTANVERLLASGIRSFQISLDGDRPEHNRIRFANGNDDSYGTILSNVGSLIPDASISVRFNVSPKNCYGIESAIRDLARVDPLRKLYIYFSPIYSHYNGVDRPGKHATGFGTVQAYADVESLLLRELGNAGYPFDWSFLNPRSLPCSAVKADGMMIGPTGDVHKCDHELGVNSTRLGTVETGMNQIDKLRTWLEIHPKNNPHCPDCVLLPTCLGYCASIRKFVDSPDQACPSKKYNYSDRIDLGMENLAAQSPTAIVGRVSVYRTSSFRSPIDDEACVK